MSASTVGEVVQWEGARGDAVVKPLQFCVFGDTNPTVEVGTIVEMDHVTEYPEESSIRSRKPLQSRVRIAELFLREGAGRRMPERTLHVTIGWGIFAPHRCTGRCRSPGAWRDRGVNGPSNHPYRISRGTAHGICLGVDDGWSRRREDGGRDERPDASIDAGAAGAAIGADGCARVGCQGRCRFCGSWNRAWRQEGGARKATPPVVPPTRGVSRARTATPSILPPACTASTGDAATAAGEKLTRRAVLGFYSRSMGSICWFFPMLLSRGLI
jgi:hypothetical protein